MGEYLLISDAAKQVKVESHVLRYWEEELHLPTKRNELGHRYYTENHINLLKNTVYYASTQTLIFRINAKITM